MKQTQFIMGMPITLELNGIENQILLDEVFDFFRQIDNQFSTYKKNSEISRINRGEISKNNYSKLMKQILKLCEQTKQQTNGFFDCFNSARNSIDPSGIVKGWAIYQASKIVKDKNVQNFYIEAGGDIQVNGKNTHGESWRMGIKNPFNPEQIVKVIKVNSEGVATSGIYERGGHIYNPHTGEVVDEIMSLTVIGPNIYEADRFATAAFAMGKNGIQFIDQLTGFEGYLIDKYGRAIMTRKFEKYIF